MFHVKHCSGSKLKKKSGWGNTQPVVSRTDCVAGRISQVETAPWTLRLLFFKIKLKFDTSDFDNITVFQIITMINFPAIDSH